MEILPSAHKHGITDDQIEHAMRNALRIVVDPDDANHVLYIGPDSAGALLEIVVVDDSRVIHAMACRQRFLR